MKVVSFIQITGSFQHAKIVTRHHYSQQATWNHMCETPTRGARSRIYTFNHSQHSSICAKHMISHSGLGCTEETVPEAQNRPIQLWNTWTLDVTKQIFHTF